MSELDAQEWARLLFEMNEQARIERTIEEMADRFGWARDDRLKLLASALEDRASRAQRLLLWLEDNDPALAARVQEIIDKAGPPWNPSN